MDRYEHCIVEWYWAPQAKNDVGTFKPLFTVFFGNGTREAYEGGNGELAVFLGRMGADGWRISSSSTSANWIMWTLERKLA